MKYTTEQIIAAIDGAPAPVRDLLDSGSLAHTVAEIGKEHDLHVDIVGALMQVIRNILVGLISPSEAAEAIKEAGVPAEAIGPILESVNTNIFIPLRDKIREGVENEPPARIAIQSEQRTENKPEQATPKSNIQAPEPAHVTPVAPVEHTPPAPPPPPAWQPPYPQTAPPPPQFVPMPPGTYWVPVSIAQVPPPPPPQAPLPVAPAAPLPTPEAVPAPAPAPVPAPIEQTPAPRPQWTPPVNLPTGMPPVSPPPQIPITKEYGADPYREPV